MLFREVFCVAKLKDYFPDIPSVSFFREAYEYGDKAYVCFDFDDEPTLDDVYLVDIIEVLPNNYLFNDGIAVLCEVTTYDENKLADTEEIEGVLIYPCKNGKALTSEGLKYFATVVEGDRAKRVLLTQEGAKNSFLLEMVLEVPKTILNLRINIAGNLVFRRKEDIETYIKNANFGEPLFYNGVISIEVGKNTLVFDDYKIYENNVISKELDGKSLFEYMCYNCEPTTETKNKMNFLKRFPLIIKQIVPKTML